MGERDMESCYDAIIVGAGPAGCAAAAELSRAGRSALLLDRARFPRDKVCGDGLSGAALVSLDRLGLLPAVMELSPQPARRVVVSGPNGRVLEHPVPRAAPGVPWGVVVERRRVDHALFRSVSGLPGVDAADGHALADLAIWQGRVHGVRVRTPGGAEAFVRCRTVIGADGAHSRVAKKLGLASRDPRHRGMAVRAYFTGVSGLSDAIEIHYEKAILPGYGWIFPTGPDTANVGAGYLVSRTGNVHLGRLFRLFLENNPQAAAKLAHARMEEGSLRAWPLPLGTAPGRRGTANALLAGDAAGFVDPLTGEGVWYALESGAMAARAVADALDQDAPQAALMLYERAWRRAFLWREFIPGGVLQRLASKRIFLNHVVDKAAKRRKTRSLLVGAISHQIPKARLFIYH
ncbi:MAG: geranylgeranyl reductase family protein [Pseudomonadota bacterium]